MEFLKSWAFSLITAAAAGTLATVIVPRGSMDKTLRAVVGIFVVAVICSPLAEIKKQESALDIFADFDEAPFDDSYIENLHENMLGIFESTVNSCVKESASQLNIDVISVNADIFFDENQCINIHKIEVVISNCQPSEKKKLSQKISEKLGAPVEIIAE